MEAACYLVLIYKLQVVGQLCFEED
ncbi:uncharacterized protein METZ01_LOCUS30349 [marine metagenome]|uniref:Uncharacterized protein n=1 Tax=marine metagenome TaxID=408172 RepID=A0A381QDU1_9ZZZZ